MLLFLSSYLSYLRFHPYSLNNAHNHKIDAGKRCAG